MYLRSPAKINFFLEVLSKRADGYHNLNTLMQTVDLFDFLRLSFAPKDSLFCNQSQLLACSQNLIFKAADIFRKKTGLAFGLEAFLEKNIPMEAGLGGGSSNAASTLWGLNKMTGLNVGLSDLIEWAGEVGSDVPFFFSQGTAQCTGRGEAFRNVENPCQGPFWIVKPLYGLSTQTVFKHFQFPNGKVSHKNTFRNDLEAIAFQLKPELAELKNTLLSAGFHQVMMSGSGTAFICLGEGKIPGTLFARKVQCITRSEHQWY